MTQFRYYADENNNNSPNWRWTQYCATESFKAYSPILSLGVQTLPGTKFFINDSLTPIIIGNSGIFELDVSNTSVSINNIRFDQQSMETISSKQNGYLLIDVIYEDQKEREV